jgi:DNA-binding response OmpR family regulator
MNVVDEPTDSILMRQAFTQAQWNVDIQEALPGEGTIAMLRHNRLHSTMPDLVILDCLRDGETCLDTLKIIRAYPSYHSQRVIVLSAIRPSQDIVNECLYFDALMVLDKPADLPGLVDMATHFKTHFMHTGDVTPRGSWIVDRSPVDVVAQQDLMFGS